MCNDMPDRGRNILRNEQICDLNSNWWKGRSLCSDLSYIAYVSPAWFFKWFLQTLRFCSHLRYYSIYLGYYSILLEYYSILLKYYSIPLDSKVASISESPFTIGCRMFGNCTRLRKLAQASSIRNYGQNAMVWKLRKLAEASSIRNLGKTVDCQLRCVNWLWESESFKIPLCVKFA